MVHDRAAFGGGVFVLGLTTFVCLWWGRPSRRLRQAVATAGLLSLARRRVHLTAGYTDTWHLVPPVVAAVLLATGLVLWRGQPGSGWQVGHQ